MKRLKSIDIFRGLSMLWLVFAHLQPQWLTRSYEHNIFAYVTFSIMDTIGACAFLFLSGISSILSYQNRKEKTIISENYTMQQVKNEYYFRALIIFLMGLVVNIALAFVNMDARWILAWDFLQAISASLALAWPLLKTSKLFRIIVAIIFWIINEIILFYLRPHINQKNILDIIFILLYTTIHFDSIFMFFTFFLIGTVFGEIIYEYLFIEDKDEKSKYLKNNILIPSFTIGGILIISGILLYFPEFLNSMDRALSWRIYALGVDLTIISLLLLIEEHDVFSFKKNYRFLFYYSYYSFTVYASHYLLTLIFWHSLQADILFWILIITTLILYGLLLNLLYKKIGPKVSIKHQINRLSVGLAQIIEERKKS